MSTNAKRKEREETSTGRKRKSEQREIIPCYNIMVVNEHAPYKRGVAQPEKWHSQKYETNIKWPPIQGQQIRPPNTALGVLIFPTTNTP